MIEEIEDKQDDVRVFNMPRGVIEVINMEDKDDDVREVDHSQRTFEEIEIKGKLMMLLF